MREHVAGRKESLKLQKKSAADHSHWRLLARPITVQRRFPGLLRRHRSFLTGGPSLASLSLAHFHNPQGYHLWKLPVVTIIPPVSCCELTCPNKLSCAGEYSSHAVPLFSFFVSSSVSFYVKHKSSSTGFFSSDDPQDRRYVFNWVL